MRRVGGIFLYFKVFLYGGLIYFDFQETFGYFIIDIYKVFIRNEYVEMIQIYSFCFGEVYNLGEKYCM